MWLFITIQTVEFVNSSFKNKDNLLGSAYDADREGVEGKYYVWDDKELRSVLADDYDLFAKYYDISENGNWEGKNILLFGSEGFGMREHTGKYADFFVKIDMSKDIESLNISNSAAIVFHHLSYLKKKSWLFKK